MKRYILFFLILIPCQLFSQETSSLQKPKTFGVGIVPQYAIMGGTRVDLDFKLKKNGQWLVVAPQFYMNTGNSNVWDFEEMTGAGIELQHKLFLKSQPDPSGVYFAYGPVFQYFSIKDEGLSAYSFEESGTEYFGLDDEMQRVNIFKTGGNLIFGMQTVFSENFYLDAYVGTGIRFSFDNKGHGLHSYYNDWWGDFGYSGTLMVVGFRLGIML